MGLLIAIFPCIVALGLLDFGLNKSIVIVIVTVVTVYSCFDKGCKAYATMPKGSLGNTQ